VNSDDIEADLDKSVSLGAKIVSSKQEIPGVGWFGIFEDPTGNKIALYTSLDPGFNMPQQSMK
jgi:predicted enzyme related to lactoylglutathione lyase